jgi:hypothetical protein
MKNYRKNFGLKISIGFFFLQIFITTFIIILYHEQFSSTFTVGDFRSQYTAALMVRNGQLHNLYNIQSQFQSQRIIIPRLSPKSLLPFISAPPLALLLAPFAYMTFSDAYLIFCFIQLALLLIAIQILHTSFKVQLDKTKKTLVSASDIYLVAAGFLPLWIGIVFGQLSALWLCVIVISWKLSHSHKFESGLIYSLFFMKPHLLIVPFLFFVAKKEWKIIAGYMTGLFVFSVVSFSIMGSRGLLSYIQLLRAMPFMENLYGIKSSQQPTLFGVIGVLLTKNHTETLPLLPQGAVFSWVVASLLFMGIAVRVWLSRIKCSLLNTWEWSTMILMTVFTSAHTHYYDLSLLYVCFVFAMFFHAKNITPDIFTDSRLLVYRLAILCALIMISILIAVFPPVSILLYGVLFITLMRQRCSTT